MYYALLPVALYIILLLDWNISYFLKFFISKFVYSTSNGASLFLVFYFFVLIIMYLFKNKTNYFKSKKYNLLLIYMVFSVFLLNLLGNIIFFYKNNIDFSGRIIHWRGAINSFDSIIHSHIAKPSIKFILDIIRFNTKGYDTGNVFMSFLPEYYYIVISILFIFIIILSIYSIMDITAKFKHFNFIILYFLTSAAVLKSILDGGILSHHTILSLIVFSSLLVSRNETLFNSFWKKYGFAVFLCYFLFYMVLVYHFSYEKELPPLGDIVFISSVYVILIYWQNLNIYFVVLLFLYISVNIYYDMKLYLIPILVRVDSNISIYNYNKGRILQVNNMEMSSDYRICDIYKYTGDDPFKPSHTLIKFSNIKNDNQVIKLKVIPLHFISSKGTFFSMNNIKLTNIKEKDGVFELYFFISQFLPNPMIEGFGDIISKNNFYVYMHIFNEILQRSGWHEYISLLDFEK